MVRSVWSRLRRRTPEERALLAEALLWLLLVGALLPFASFRRIARLLGLDLQQGVAADPGPGAVALAARVGWAVEAAARRTPRPSLCLAQGLAAAAMLRRRRVPGSLAFGVRQRPGAPFEAHAWARCGPAIVTGAAGHEGFTPLMEFRWGG